MIIKRTIFAARYPDFLKFADNGKLFTEPEESFPSKVISDIRRFLSDENIAGSYEFYFNDMGDIEIISPPENDR